MIMQILEGFVLFGWNLLLVPAVLLAVWLIICLATNLGE